jgi:hypothetical protein
MPKLDDSEHPQIGVITAPAIPMVNRSSGGAVPPYFDTARRFAHLFQYGCVPSAMTMPNPIPKKESPVSCGVKPCFCSKIIGNAWKARYKTPRINAHLKLAGQSFRVPRDQ